MKSFLQSFFTLKSQASSRRFEQPKKLLIVGLDAAGKTTFLYCIKDHEQQVVTTIPTIGFNVETVQAKNLNFTCWDVGGCDKIRPLWKHYFEGTAGIVFVVDSNDSERIQGAKDELQFFLDAVPSTVPLLVIANKMDLPAAKPVDWVLNSLGLNDVTNRHWEIMPCIAVSKEAAKPCLDCLQGMLCASPYPSQGSLTSNFASDHGGISSGVYFSNQLIAAPSISQYSNSSIQSSLNSTPKRQQEVAEDKEKQLLQLQLQQHEKQKLESIWKDWLSRAESIPLNEETRQNELFLQQLLRCNLPSWDHYQHIRLAYLLFKQYGVDEGFERIAESIRNYIANNSSQTNGKSFHATMTAFWSHFIAYWMLKYSNLELDEEDVSSERDKSAFYYFLLFVYQKKTVFTDIGQSGLFRQYYSNDVIFHGNAKESFQSPNLQPFPSLQYSPEFSFDGK